MVGLVEAIQRDAIDPNVKVSTLLRKVKLAAAKLRLPQIEEWVEYELNGYPGEVPAYRQIDGQPKAFNPYRGWIPFGGNAATIRKLSKASTGQSIAAIEDLVGRNDDDGIVYQNLPPELISKLNEGMGIQFGQMAIHISKTDIVAILDVVRNKILDWAISLEKEGVSGEDFSFDEQERERAHASNMTVNIGSVGNFAGNLGHGNTARDIVASQNDSRVFADLSAALSRAVSDAEERQGLMERIAEMEAAKLDRGAFANAYGRFMSAAANHMAVVAPFVPALGTFLSS